MSTASPHLLPFTSQRSRRDSAQGEECWGLGDMSCLYTCLPESLFAPCDWARLTPEVPASLPWVDPSQGRAHEEPSSASPPLSPAASPNPRRPCGRVRLLLVRHQEQ